MKRLMIAASAAAVGLAAFADVYSVKFTTTTLVDASKKVKVDGVKTDVDYYKKGTVTINGLYDDGNGSYLPVYYFWTGTGKTMTPIKDVVFEMSNYVDMDSQVNGKNFSLNVGLYFGTKEDPKGYFVSGGIGKVKTVGGGDVQSASGSFGGVYYGLPAYGSWSLSKDKKLSNSSNKQQAIADYIAKQGKKASVDIAAWEGAVHDATSIAQQAAEIKALIDEVAGKDRQIGLLEEELFLANEKIKQLEEQGGDAKLLKKWQDYAAALKAELEKAKASVDSLFGSLDGQFLKDALTGMTNTLTVAHTDATNRLAEIEAAVAAYEAAGANVTTNEYGGIDWEKTTISEDWTNSLWTVWTDATNEVRIAEDGVRAVNKEIFKETEELEYMYATRLPYDEFVDAWSNKIEEAKAAIEGFKADKDNADAWYANQIASIAGRYESVVAGLEGAIVTYTNILDQSNAVYTARLADYDFVTTNKLARYTKDDEGYQNWLEDEWGYDRAMKIDVWYAQMHEAWEGYTKLYFETGYDQFRNGLVKHQRELQKAVEEAGAGVKAIEDKVASLKDTLAQVKAAGKAEPSKWVGKAAELRVKFAMARDKAKAEADENIAFAEELIKTYESQIESKKATTPYTDAQIDAQIAVTNYLATNDLVIAEDILDDANSAAQWARWEAEDPEWAFENRADNLYWLLSDDVGEHFYPWQGADYQNARDYTVGKLTEAKKNAEAGLATAAALMNMKKPEIVIPDFPADPDTPTPDPEGGDTPADPEGGDTPAEPEGGDTPSEGGDTPSEGGDTPSEGGDTPAPAPEGGETPAEEGEKA